MGFEARAHPFSGTLTTILTREDLFAFREQVQGLVLPGEVTLGGGRAAELRLHAEVQIGGTAGALAVEAELTPSADDPSPLLRWLLFGVPSFTAECVRASDHHVRDEGTDNLRDLSEFSPVDDDQFRGADDPDDAVRAAGAHDGGADRWVNHGMAADDYWRAKGRARAEDDCRYS